ncbi:MAG: cytochrome c biogenesis protein CcsA [Bacteroidetes bacterium]|nr:cytochrome c biogenesis protein CcsA [Bacteroidota bacterium]
MHHYFIGNLGHFFVIASLVTALVASFSYWRATSSATLNASEWLINGRTAFALHSISVVGIVFALFLIIYGHYFEYHYAYAHSSLHLPGQYMISCFWEGQEGSFLLWMFWQAAIGIILIITQKQWEAPAMTIFSLVQAFLASMILGVVIPGLELKIGSSPFILLRDAMPDPIFKMQPDFIPKDGNGLNPLLQNYWMVIHPPTLFLGFALTLVPFSFCMAGLWLRKYTEWIQPALPWTLVGGAILGLGILMGGYWAYETLSFGGYWNWDPVENAVYIPWLVQIASLHTMITWRSSKMALRLTMGLVIAVFILILYSTFLTRSGILGDASVHSFTDLGLSGQLLIYLLFFTFVSIWLMALRWKDMPVNAKEVETYSKEFWIFLGAAILCLMGFQVLVPTSIPVYNKIVELFGIRSNLAPPADQLAFYSRFQLWFAVLLSIVSGTAQYYWWGKLEAGEWKKKLMGPFLLTLVLFALILVIARITNPVYMALLLASLYLIISNARILLTVTRKNPGLSGGGIAHIGVGLMFVGILFSSGYSKVVSLNNTGLLYNREMGDEFNRDNLLLFVNEPRTMADYDIEFLGERYEIRSGSGYVKKSDVESTQDPFRVTAKRDIQYAGRLLYHARDTFEIFPENTYYEIQLRKGEQVAATLYPRIQLNPSMGGFLASPDIRRGLASDIYTSVSAPMNRESEPEWSPLEEQNVKIGKEFFVNDYVAVLESVERVYSIQGFKLSPDDAAVVAHIRIRAEHEDYYADPVFLIRNKSEVGRLPFEIGELGARLTLLNIHPDSDEFTIGINTRQKDWVIIKAFEKPYINILWLGTGILMVGFVVATRRRYKEY